MSLDMFVWFVTDSNEGYDESIAWDYLCVQMNDRLTLETWISAWATLQVHLDTAICDGFRFCSQSHWYTAEVCTHGVVVGLPRQYGPGLGFGQGEVLQIGLVEKSGQRSEVRWFGMHVIHVTGELRQQLLLLGLGHSTKTNGWEKSKQTDSWKPPTPRSVMLERLGSVGILCGSLFSVY